MDRTHGVWHITFEGGGLLCVGWFENVPCWATYDTPVSEKLHELLSVGLRRMTSTKQIVHPVVGVSVPFDPEDPDHADAFFSELHGVELNAELPRLRVERRKFVAAEDEPYPEDDGIVY